jgi:hypothetical protein
VIPTERTTAERPLVQEAEEIEVGKPARDGAHSTLSSNVVQLLKEWDIEDAADALEKDGWTSLKKWQHMDDKDVDAMKLRRATDKVLKAKLCTWKAEQEAEQKSEKLPQTATATAVVVQAVTTAAARELKGLVQVLKTEELLLPPSAGAVTQEEAAAKKTAEEEAKKKAEEAASKKAAEECVFLQMRIGSLNRDQHIRTLNAMPHVLANVLSKKLEEMERKRDGVERSKHEIEKRIDTLQAEGKIALVRQYVHRLHGGSNRLTDDFDRKEKAEFFLKELRNIHLREEEEEEYDQEEEHYSPPPTRIFPVKCASRLPAACGVS